MGIRQAPAVFSCYFPRIAPSQPAPKYYPKHSDWHRQH
nr:MAG TPA: hypothetical protein [Caudoviricetes sp.]